MATTNRFPTTALAASVFVFLTAEMLPVGLMPELAAGLDATPSRIGTLVGGYAAVAAVLGIPITMLCRRWSRRRVLTGCLVWLGLGQIALALAPTLTVALVARSAGAATHVVVWGTAPLAAAALAEPGRQGRATGRVFLGSTLALLLGVPATTLAGQHLGWRTASAVLALLALGAAILLHRTLPEHLPAPTPETSSPTTKAVGGSATAVVAATALAVTGLYAYCPYLSQHAQHAGLTGTGYATLLVALGGAGILGVALASGNIDARPRLTTALTLLFGAALPTLFHSAAVPLVFTVVVATWGVALAATPVVLQAAIVRTSGTRGDLASSAYVVAFQIGIAAGSWLGGHLEIYPFLACGLGVAALVAVTNNPHPKETYPCPHHPRLREA